MATLPAPQPFGFWTLPALNLSLCAVPKGGSTMNRQLVARGAGLLPPPPANATPAAAACWYGWSADDNARLAARGVVQAYSPHTTNVAILRDPWDRAVSAFADQIARGQLPSNATTPAAFLAFLERPLVEGHHTGTAAHHCLGLRGARFDHLIDLASVADFARVARHVPAFAGLIDRGWEHCTGGEPRLYLPGSIATHRNRDPTMPHRLCFPHTLAKVCRVYADDYALYRALGRPYACECKRTVAARVPA